MDVSGMDGGSLFAAVVAGFALGGFLILMAGIGILEVFLMPPSTSQQSVVDHGCAEWHTVEIVDGEAVVEFRWLHEVDDE